MTAYAALESPPEVAPGRYRDDWVEVDRVTSGPTISAAEGKDGRVHVRHRFDSDRIDDDLAEILAQLLGPVADDPVIFQRAFVGVVATCDRDPDRAWERFYENSLARIRDPSRTDYVEIHRHALALLEGHASVLDLGCSFGFLALALARRRVHTIAADPDANTMRLLTRMTEHLQVPLTVLRCDGHCVPLPARSVEAVALLHVLEHTGPAAGAALLAEALRLAERRVIVAVPYEDGPSALFGHVRTFRHDDLVAIGARSGWNHRVYDHHGGWIVLDRIGTDQDEPVRDGPIDARMG